MLFSNEHRKFRFILKSNLHVSARPKNKGLKMEFKIPDNQLNNQSTGGGYVPKSNG